MNFDSPLLPLQFRTSAQPTGYRKGVRCPSSWADAHFLPRNLLSSASRARALSPQPFVGINRERHFLGITNASRILAVLATASHLTAGETRVIHGYARQPAAGPILLSPSALQSTVLMVPAPPGDRLFMPPQRIDWEVEITGVDASGIRLGTALRTAPSGFEWPAGHEIVAGRYHGSLGGIFPSDQPFDPLNIQAGSGIPDYDGDGVSDDQDAFPGDPSESVDTDSDGIGNNADPDDDNDGMPDTWEAANGTDPLVKDADMDNDGDGFTNGAEYVAGTSPQDPASFFRVSRVERAEGFVRITFDAVPGRTYAIWRQPGLAAVPIVMAHDITTASAQPLTICVPAAEPSDFYNLQVSLSSPP